MAWQYHPLILFFFLAGLIALCVAFFSAYTIDRHGLRYPVAVIGLFGFHNAIWAVAAGFKMAITDLQLKLLFYKLEYLGSAVSPSLALLVAITLVGWDRYLDKKTLGIVAVVPAVAIPLVLVNPQQIMITDPTMVQSHGLALLEHRLPPLFVLLLAWGLGLALLAASIVGVGIRRGTMPFRPGFVAILVFVVPVIVITLKVAHIYPPGGRGINVTPAANAVVLGLLAVSIVKYRIYDLLPVGRHQAVEVMGDGYLLVNREETVVDHNQMASDILAGDPERNLRNIPVQSFFSEDLEQAFEDSTQPQFTIEERTIQILRSPITTNGAMDGQVLLLRDITEKADHIEELERANRRLDKFASIVSHDLRNPLNIARGRVDLAGEKTETDDIAIASQALERMEAIIDDVLTLTRQGQAVTSMEWRRLSEIAQSSWLNCDTADGDLVVESDLRVCCDSSRLKRLLENLYRNTIEHAGTDCTVRVGSLAHESGFYIADDGPGIPKEDRDRLVEYEYSTAAQSSGLGLAIVKEITQAHGWQLRLSDSSEGGARIEVTDMDTESL